MALQTKKITANGSKGHHKFTLTVTENSTSLTGNSSAVAFSLDISPVVKGFDWVSNSGKVKYAVTVSDKTYSGIIASYDGSSTVTVKSGTLTVTHNADGTKTIPFRFRITDSTGWSFAPGNCDADDTMELTDIPRQATITAAPDFTDEEDPTITYANPAGEAVSGLEACISLDGSNDDIAYRAISATGTAYTFPLTEAERAVLRNATPGAGKKGNTRTVLFFVRTNIGGMLYYHKQERTLTLINAEPIIQPQLVEADAQVLAAAPGVFLRNLSDIRFTIGAQAQKGAAIVSQSVSCGGDTVEAAEGTLYDIKSGQLVFTATDTRGNTTVLPVSVPFTEYIKPTCSIGGSKPDTDGNFTLTASGMCYTGQFPQLGDNQLQVQCCYRAGGGEYTQWMPMTLAKGENAYTATAEFTGLDYRTTYTFRCKVTDTVTATTTDEVAVKAMPVFDWSENDFAFHVPVSAPSLTLGGVETDYIAEQGSSGIWTYRKWASGAAECAATSSVVVPQALTQSGAVYYSEPVDVAYPFAITDARKFTAIANMGILAAQLYGADADKLSFRLACTNEAMAGKTVTVHMYVCGRWK